MFHEVRVFKPDGSLKKVISEEQLSQLHWRRFYYAQQEANLAQIIKISEDMYERPNPLLLKKAGNTKWS